MQNIYIKFVSFSFHQGGAGIAANKFASIASTFPNTQISLMSQDDTGKIQLLKRLFSYALTKLQYDNNPIKHSINLFSYSPVLKSFRKNFEVLHHIHWINNDTIGIFNFHRIPPGTIITLHDEWIYCGTEHVYKATDTSDYFEHGYPFFSKKYLGFPWNGLVWRIKKKQLSHCNNLIFTVPSNWMLERAKRSQILSCRDIRLLPNPIDTQVFTPSTPDVREQFRMQMGIQSKDFVFCFGAVGGKKNLLKGANLLSEALLEVKRILPESISDCVKLLVFGGKNKGSGSISGFDAFNLGHISSPSELALIYSSANCVVVPSMVESFGQIAAEALSCETPVISFACSGLLDIVLDQYTGLTAEPYSVPDLAKKLKDMVLMDNEQAVGLGRNGRKHVETCFSYPVITAAYQSIINDAFFLKGSAK